MMKMISIMPNSGGIESTRNSQRVLIVLRQREESSGLSFDVTVLEGWSVGHGERWERQLGIRLKVLTMVSCWIIPLLSFFLFV